MQWYNFCVSFIYIYTYIIFQNGEFYLTNVYISNIPYGLPPIKVNTKEGNFVSLVLCCDHQKCLEHKRHLINNCGIKE